MIKLTQNRIIREYSTEQYENRFTREERRTLEGGFSVNKWGFEFKHTAPPGTAPRPFLSNINCAGEPGPKYDLVFKQEYTNLPLAEKILLQWYTNLPLAEKILLQWCKLNGDVLKKEWEWVTVAEAGKVGAGDNKPWSGGIGIFGGESRKNYVWRLGYCDVPPKTTINLRELGFWDKSSAKSTETPDQKVLREAIKGAAMPGWVRYAVADRYGYISFHEEKPVTRAAEWDSSRWCYLLEKETTECQRIPVQDWKTAIIEV